MNPILRCGVIGLGWPAFQHTRAMGHVAGTQMILACDLDPVRRAAFSAEFPHIRMCETPGEMLDDPTIDAVFVCLPNFLHGRMTRDAFSAGKHVLCEKPPTLDVGEMREIRTMAAAAGLTYAFGRQFRFDTSMLAAREFVERGGIGRAYFGKGQWLRMRGAPSGIGGWFMDKARSGGGVVIDLGIHSLDAVWYLAGRPRPLRVSAQTGRHFLSDNEGNVEDSGFAFLRFENDFVVALELAWSINMGQAGARRVDWTGLEATNTTLHGPKASLQLTPPAVFSAGGSSGKDWVQAELPAPTNPSRYAALPRQTGSFARQIEDFARAIHTETAPTNSADDAVELMKMITGIYASSAAGCEVALDDDQPG